jgi:predicted transcriptional regulator
MSVKSVVTCVTLPRTLKAKVDAYAKEQDVPMATIMRRALIEYLDLHKEKDTEKIAA